MTNSALFFLVAGLAVGACGFLGFLGPVGIGLAKAVGATSVICFFILQYFGAPSAGPGDSSALKTGSSKPRR